MIDPFTGEKRKFEADEDLPFEPSMLSFNLSKLGDALAAGLMPADVSQDDKILHEANVS